LPIWRFNGASRNQFDDNFDDSCRSNIVTTLEHRLVTTPLSVAAGSPGQLAVDD
jgi:hypothetical protein